MIKIFDRVIKTSILSSLVFLLLGILLFVKPETTLTSISYIIGIMLIILGFISLIKYLTSEFKQSLTVELIYGIVSMIVGVLLILNPTTIASIIPFILGIWIVINSAIKIQYSVTLKNYDSNNWVYTLTVAILMFICGLVLILNPFEGAVIITKTIGIFIIIYSILDLSECFLFKKNIKIIKDAISDNNIIDAEVVEDKKSKRKRKK